jgi:hypothetical protein
MSDGLAENAAPSINTPSTGTTPFCTVEHVPGHLRMHTISEDKLDMLVSCSAPLHLTFFGICFGAALSFGMVLYNGSLDPTHKLVYQCLLFPSVVMAAYFGIRGGRDYFRSRDKLNEIKGLKKSN